jgi:ankyrin repeat protein
VEIKILRRVLHAIDATPARWLISTTGLGLSAIGDAAKCGHAKCIRTLLSLGAAVDPRRKNGKTPLHEACANGHVECVQCLVDGGADVNAVDNNGMQPVDLAMASVTNREAVLEVLRAADATLRAAHATLRGADACDACADDGCGACADT